MSKSGRNFSICAVIQRCPICEIDTIQSLRHKPPKCFKCGGGIIDESIDAVAGGTYHGNERRERWWKFLIR